MASFIAPNLSQLRPQLTASTGLRTNRLARLPRLPDLLTTANLCCGMGSILLASQGQLTAACWLVFAGAVFDVFDGLAARAMGGGSPLGTQLDSLADMDGDLAENEAVALYMDPDVSPNFVAQVYAGIGARGTNLTLANHSRSAGSSASGESRLME